jgi:hypothetical protein
MPGGSADISPCYKLPTPQSSNQAPDEDVAIMSIGELDPMNRWEYITQGPSMMWFERIPVSGKSRIPVTTNHSDIHHVDATLDGHLSRGSG